MPVYNDIQIIKREFFSRRNGVIADALRKSGNLPYKVIFGLNIPQIKEIAAAVGKNSEIASRLWDNRSTRESGMLAPYLMDAGSMTADDAVGMLGESPCAEITDVVCMALLRNHPFAEEIADRAIADGNVYAGLRLYMNLLALGKVQDVDKLREIARGYSASENRSVSYLAGQIQQELEYIN